MRIKKLVIYGYGKWIDAEFDLSSSIQVIQGQNEAGKSTLMSFIHSILFGFPTRHSSALRYEPKESSRYGGKVILDDDRFGEVTIERVNGKVTGDVTVTLEDGTEGDERLLDTILHKKNRSFYEQIYSFDLKGVEETKGMNREQFNRFFLSVGSFGNEQFLKQADQYKQKASQLFKPTGRKPKVNELYRSLKKQKEQLSKAKEKNETYIIRVKGKETVDAEMDQLEKELKQKREERDLLNHHLKHIETIEELNRLKREIDQYPDQSLPEDGLIQLNQINRQLEKMREQTKELHEKQNALQDKYRPSKELLVYQENEKAVDQLTGKWDQLELKADSIRELKQQITLLEQQTFEFKLREGLSLQDDLPEDLTSDSRGQVQLIDQSINRLDQEEKESNETIERLKLKIEHNEEQIDSIEETLWPLSTFKAVEAEEKQKRTLDTPKVSERKPVILITSFLLLLAFLALVLQNWFPLLGVFLLAGVWTIMARRKGEAVNYREPDYDRSEYYYQKKLRQQWKDTLASIDSLQQQIGEEKDSQNRIRQEKEKYAASFSEWKSVHRYPEHYSLTAVMSSMEKMSEIRKVERQQRELSDRLSEQITELDKELRQNAFTRTIYEDEQDPLNVFSEARKKLRQIEQDKRLQQAYIKETEKIQNAVLYFVQQEKEQNKMKHELYDQASAKNEEAFIRAYHTLEEKNEKIRRYEHLSSTIDVSEQSLALSGEDVKSKLMELAESAEELESLYKEKARRSVELAYEIKELEEGGTYSELLQKYENEKSIYQDAADQWSTYKIASSLIERTLNNAKANQLPQTIALAEKYFSSLTSGDYPSILMDSDEFFVIDRSGKKWAAEELSRGTVEPLYAAIRLAFVVSFKDTVRFPVIIDDSFVNVDEARKSKLYDLLNEVCQSVQVIYFTFDSTITDYVPESHVLKLN
ncbi:AAA family ATPase [Alkalibacterium sp. m-11]|uniref:AAA family ATPase n=1 Tax=Alkalibacterium indicireducens TaxID=398758 RepID=A0ABP3KBG2_9LACT